MPIIKTLQTPPKMTEKSGNVITARYRSCRVGNRIQYVDVRVRYGKLVDKGTESESTATETRKT